ALLVQGDGLGQVPHLRGTEREVLVRQHLLPRRHLTGEPEAPMVPRRQALADAVPELDRQLAQGWQAVPEADDLDVLGVQPRARRHDADAVELRLGPCLGRAPRHEVREVEMQVLVQPGARVPAWCCGFDGGLEGLGVDRLHRLAVKRSHRLHRIEHLGATLLESLERFVLADVVDRARAGLLGTPRAGLLLLPRAELRGRSSGDAAEESVVELVVVLELQPVVHRLVVRCVVRKLAQQLRPAHLGELLRPEVREEGRALPRDLGDVGEDEGPPELRGQVPVENAVCLLVHRRSYSSSTWRNSSVRNRLNSVSLTVSSISVGLKPASADASTWTLILMLSALRPSALIMPV